MPKKAKAKKEFNLERPPVIAMLGHVDHGKTSILDAIRGTKVQEGEAGGITQSVRAHQVQYKAKDGKIYPVTFVDTPGHEAFSEMRSRGAFVTDIALLVVAVDDGVQPQTKEAIKFIKEAKVPVVVALNKIDIKGVDKAKVKRDLSTAGVQVEELGGDVVIVETSAKKNEGLDELMETLLLTAEMNELKKRKPKQGKAEAVVLESTVDKSLGPISLCIVKAGEVNIGDWVAWEDECGKIRAVKDEYFKDVDQVDISDPVWLAGFNKSIDVGVTLYLYKNTQDAKSALKECIKEDEADDEEFNEEVLAQLLESQKDDQKPKLNIILKAESQGTLEVAKSELLKLSTEETEVSIFESTTGEINRDDILKAKNIGGIVIGFKTGLPRESEKIAKQEKVLVRNYEIIYDLLDEVEEVVESLTEPESKEVEIARAVVKKVFELSDGSIVAGCRVSKGTVLKGYTCYVERPSAKKESEKRIGEGKITSLKQGKEEVKEAPKGTECGILLEPQVEVEKDDEIVCFKIEKE